MQQVLVSISDLTQQIFVVFLQTVSVYCTQNSPKVKMPVHEKVEINFKKLKKLRFCQNCLDRWMCLFVKVWMLLFWIFSSTGKGICMNVQQGLKLLSCEMVHMYICTNDRWLKKLAKLQCTVCLFKSRKLQRLSVKTQTMVAVFSACLSLAYLMSAPSFMNPFLVCSLSMHKTV